MKKIIIVIFSLVFLSSNVFANDSRINEFIEKKENIEKFLEGPISHNTFKRLNWER